MNPYFRIIIVGESETRPVTHKLYQAIKRAINTTQNRLMRQHKKKGVYFETRYSAIMETPPNNRM